MLHRGQYTREQRHASTGAKPLWNFETKTHVKRFQFRQTIHVWVPVRSLPIHSWCPIFTSNADFLFSGFLDVTSLLLCRPTKRKSCHSPKSTSWCSNEKRKQKLRPFYSNKKAFQPILKVNFINIKSLAYNTDFVDFYNSSQANVIAQIIVATESTLNAYWPRPLHHRLQVAILL